MDCAITRISFSVDTDFAPSSAICDARTSYLSAPIACSTPDCWNVLNKRPNAVVVSSTVVPVIEVNFATAVEKSSNSAVGMSICAPSEPICDNSSNVVLISVDTRR